MFKEYLAEQARLEKLDCIIARTDEERHAAMRRLHKTVNLAAEMYGFDFADSLTQQEV